MKNILTISALALTLALVFPAVSLAEEILLVEETPVPATTVEETLSEPVVEPSAADPAPTEQQPATDNPDGGETVVWGT